MTHILMPARNLSLLQLSVIMSTEKAAQGHTTVEEEEEAIMMNMQSGGSNPSSGSYESPEDEFAHLLPKKRVQNGLDDLGSDYIPKQEEVW
jgi:hypothetical protein